MAFIDDIATYLQTNGIGTIGTDLFKGYLPDTESGTHIGVYDTGGPAPDVDLTSLKNPTMQILVRSNSYSAGKTKIEAIRNLLHGVINTTIGSTFVLFMNAQSEGGHIGRNQRGQDEFSINFIARTR